MIGLKKGFALAFAATYIILTIILTVAIYSKVPKVDLAKKMILGLVILSMFAVGFLAGSHMTSASTEEKKWHLADIVQAAAGAVVLVLALVVMIAISKATPDMEAAKKAMKGLYIIIGMIGFSAVLEKGKDTDVSKYYTF